jgi:hypothetical protein
MYPAIYPRAARASKRLAPTAMQPAALAPGAGCVSARQRGAAVLRPLADKIQRLII